MITSAESNNKLCYRDHCLLDASVPIFCRDWWLDAVAPGQWDVALVKENGRVIAAMPYVMRKRMVFYFISQPPLTQFSGPWLAPNVRREQKRLEFEKKLFCSLIEQLPKFHYFDQNWNFRLTNWIPFYWSGFHQTTRYTYRLENIDSENLLWKGLSSNIRREIRKAVGRFSLSLRSSPTIDEFLELNELTFSRQGKDIPYKRDLVRRLDNSCLARGCRKIFIAEDPEGRAHAGVYIVWDESSAYYLMGGGHPSLRTSGATSFVMWEAIKFSASVTESFDFEGSMIEPIERFFRAFGATQTPYHRVFKTNSRILSIIRGLKESLQS